MKKYVLDTNVLMIDPTSIFRFEDNEVILPITVIEELDNGKTDMRSEAGKCVRAFFSKFDVFIDEGDLRKGITINDKGGTLRTDVRYTIESHDVDLPLEYGFSTGADRSIINDNRIMNCTYINDAVLVTNDRALRLKAAAYGIPTQKYMNDRVEIDDYYTGTGEVFVEGDLVERLYKEKFVPAQDILDFFPGIVYPNMYFIVKNMYNEKQAALTVFNSVMGEIQLLVTDEKIMGLDGRNAEQHFALAACCDPEIKIVSLIGKAGCGKSLMAIAAGLHCVTQEPKEYKKMLVFRPIVPMGNDIGYLPGSKEEKLGPWMQAISDNIDFIMSDMNAEDRPKIKAPKKPKKDPTTNKHDIPILGEKEAGRVSPTTELTQQGYLELDCGTFIRGRSIPNVYMIIDEGQNLTPHEMKTIITRAGEGTKIIITGDPSQIDSPYLDATNNGLSYVTERFKDQKIAATVKFTKSERSELAELAAELL